MRTTKFRVIIIIRLEGNLVVKLVSVVNDVLVTLSLSAGFRCCMQTRI